MTEKQKKQKARSWFKFVITGLAKPVQKKHLSEKEKFLWKTIENIRAELLLIHDATSREMGLDVPYKRCVLCRKKSN